MSIEQTAKKATASIWGFFNKEPKATEPKVVKTVRPSKFDVPTAKTPEAPKANEVDAVEHKINGLVKGFEAELLADPVVQDAVEFYRPLGQADVNASVALAEHEAAVKFNNDAVAAAEHILKASLDLAVQIKEKQTKLAQLAEVKESQRLEKERISALLKEPCDLDTLVAMQRHLMRTGKEFSIKETAAKAQPKAQPKAEPKAEPSLPKNFSDCTTEAQRAEWAKANNVEITAVKTRELSEEAPPVVVKSTATTAVVESNAADGDKSL